MNAVSTKGQASLTSPQINSKWISSVHLSVSFYRIYIIHPRGPIITWPGPKVSASGKIPENG